MEETVFQDIKGNSRVHRKTCRQMVEDKDHLYELLANASDPEDECPSELEEIDGDDEQKTVKEKSTQRQVLISNNSQEKPNWFVYLLTEYPLLVAFFVLLMITVCTTLSFVYYPLPDFGKDPLKGTETRGTYLSRTSAELQNIVRQLLNGSYRLIPDISLSLRAANISESLIPKEYFKFDIADLVGDKERKKRSSSSSQLSSSAREPSSQHRVGSNHVIPNGKAGTASNTTEQDDASDFVHNCNAKEINTYSPHFLFESPDGSDLFSAAHLRAICRLQDEVILPYVTRSADRSAAMTCPFQSLPQVVMTIVGKANCSDVSDADVIFVRTLLEECADIIRPNSPNTGTSITDDVIEQMAEKKRRKGIGTVACVRNAVSLYRILYYLADAVFYQISYNTKLTYAISYWPQLVTDASNPNISAEDEYLLYVKHFENSTNLDNGPVRLSGIFLGEYLQYPVKFRAFGKRIYEDILIFVFAAALVFTLFTLYLRSPILLFATIANVIMSLSLAYFIYFFVLRLEFFPFINLLAAIVLIAVGSDDVFVLVDIWERSRRSFDSSEEQGAKLSLDAILTRVFSHSLLSIFVTSLTTAAAFFSTAITSAVIPLRCFGIFSGVAILANFTLTVTWVLPVMIFMEKFETRAIYSISKKQPSPFIASCSSCFNFLAVRKQVICDRIISFIADRARWVCLPVLTLLASVAVVIAFVHPGLKLPSIRGYRLFARDNLLETYDTFFVEKFQATRDGAQYHDSNVTIYIVWGFEPVDDGSLLNPDDKPTAVHPLTKGFLDFYDEESRSWFDSLCEDLRKEPYVSGSLHNWGLRSLEYVGKSSCQNAIARPYIEQSCCPKANNQTTSSVTYDKQLLRKCAPVFRLLDLKLGNDVERYQSGPLFDSNNDIVGYLLAIKTDWHFSMIYGKMKEYYQTVERLLNSRLDSAPAGLRRGFISYGPWFAFFDVQNSMAVNTMYSIALSIVIAFFVMLCISRNLLITFYAMVTIACAKATTIAVLVMLGWELNVLESAVMSLGVGLAIDFTIHYGMAYQAASPSLERKARVRESLSSVGSAVTMAALTTFAAGSSVLPCHIFGFVKLGTFLMILISLSWLYSTFFFMPLCRVIGPRGNVCQSNVRGLRACF